MKNSAFLDSKRGLFTVTLDENGTARLRRLAGQARNFFRNLDPRDWNTPQDAGFLRDIKAGALILDALAHHPAQHKLLRLSDAKLAFFALHGFAAASMAIPSVERQTAAHMMCLLANCVTVRIELAVLPVEPEVPLALAVDETVSKHLVRMLQCKESGNREYELGLGDSLCLYLALESTPCADMRLLWAAVKKVTYQLRIALSDLEE